VTIARKQGHRLRNVLSTSSPTEGPCRARLQCSTRGGGYVCTNTWAAAGTVRVLVSRRGLHGRGLRKPAAGSIPKPPLTLCGLSPLRLLRGSVGTPRGRDLSTPSGKRITCRRPCRHGRAMLVRASFEWSVYAHVVAAWNGGRAPPADPGERVAAFFTYVSGRL